MFAFWTHDSRNYDPFGPTPSAHALIWILRISHRVIETTGSKAAVVRTSVARKLSLCLMRIVNELTTIIDISKFKKVLNIQIRLA